MKATRQEKKENTKIKIADAAYAVYSKHGFTASTMMIAKKANVSHGTIFAHFPSVEELLSYLINKLGETIIEEANNLIGTDANIQNFLSIHIDILTQHENFYINLISDRSLLPREAILIFANIQSTIAFHFSEIITVTHTKNIPLHMMFNTWLGLVHYYLLNKELFSPKSSVLKRYGNELISVFLEMIKES